MPPGMRMRYDLPQASLAECLTGYAIYSASDRNPLVNWYLPAPVMISILADAGPITVAIGNHRFGPLERASLYGPTSRAFRTVTHGGVAVGIGISAIGWSRMTSRLAGDFRNRIVPLEIGIKLRRTLPNSTLRLVEGCGHMPQEEQPKATLELLKGFIGG